MKLHDAEYYENWEVIYIFIEIEKIYLSLYMKTYTEYLILS
jgi:hypothetical protein